MKTGTEHSVHTNGFNPKPNLWPLMSTANNEISCIYYQMVKYALRNGNLPRPRELLLPGFPFFLKNPLFLYRSPLFQPFPTVSLFFPLLFFLLSPVFLLFVSSSASQPYPVPSASQKLCLLPPFTSSRPRVDKKNSKEEEKKKMNENNKEKPAPQLRGSAILSS